MKIGKHDKLITDKSTLLPLYIFDTETTSCDIDHPYALESGTYCCATFTQTTQAPCDGTTIKFKSPKECCPAIDRMKCSSNAMICGDAKWGNKMGTFFIIFAVKFCFCIIW